MPYKDPKSPAARAADSRYNTSPKGQARNKKNDRKRKEDTKWRQIKFRRSRKFQENNL